MENKPQYHGASGGLEYEAAWALGSSNGRTREPLKIEKVVVEVE